jgi:nucleoid DNA-binding protein
MSENLTKRDIVLRIYEDERNQYPQKEVKDIVQQTLEAIADAMASGQNVELRNFGVFQLQVRKERLGRNPKQPEEDVVIPKRAVIKFKAGKELRDRLKDLDPSRLASPGNRS